MITKFPFQKITLGTTNYPNNLTYRVKLISNTIVLLSGIMKENRTVITVKVTIGLSKVLNKVAEDGPYLNKSELVKEILRNSLKSEYPSYWKEVKS